MKILILATAAMAFAPAMADPISVYVDGTVVNFADASPIMVHNRVMVPLRGVFERMGASVEWNEQNQTVTCVKQDKTIWLKIGDPRVRVNSNDITLDQPAILYRGSTMVPLRFISESLGGSVHWDEALQAVHVTTADSKSLTSYDKSNVQQVPRDSGHDVTLYSGTVIPVKLSQKLSSDVSKEGDKFTATIDTSGKDNYSGLPAGTKVLGHVSIAKAKTSKDPGVLGLEYDTIVAPDGSKTRINGSLIGLDEKSVENKDGTLVARPSVNDNKHQSVWIGAGAGAVLAIITKGNILTDTVIGGALGYLYELLGPDAKKPNNVTLEAGTRLGVKLDNDVVARISR